MREDNAHLQPSAEALEVDRISVQRPDAPGAHPAFERLVRTIWRLRQPDGCPWDKVQTHASIERNMLEEAYEAVAAIDEGSSEHLCEELGDVLMQVLLHAQIEADDNGFDIDDICNRLNEKLVERHPHVFGEVEAQTADEALASWNEVKRAERAAAGEAGEHEPGLLDSIPSGMPALMQAQKVSKRAADAGFDWATAQDVWEQVASERREFEAEAPGSEAAAQEFGDVLFSLVNVARKEGIDAEFALQASTRKFRRRWAALEECARRDGKQPADLTVVELGELWDEVKRRECATPNVKYPA